MGNLKQIVLVSCVAFASTALADDAVPTFKSGEYQVTTSFGDSQTMSDKVCLTDYADWFATLQDEVAERGCKLTSEGHSGSAYRYRMTCSNGANGSTTVTKIDDSNFESVSQITVQIAGFEQTISTRDSAKRLGDCPPE
jgi:hypothetical protein